MMAFWFLCGFFAVGLVEVDGLVVVRGVVAASLRRFEGGGVECEEADGDGGGE